MRGEEEEEEREDHFHVLMHGMLELELNLYFSPIPDWSPFHLFEKSNGLGNLLRVLISLILLRVADASWPETVLLAYCLRFYWHQKIKL